jgi:uncharacterized membrane protein YbhN (UPF0104 family)
MAVASARSRLVVPLIFWAGLAMAALALWLSGQVGRAWDATAGARVLPLIAVVLAGMILPFVHALRWRLAMRALESDIAPGPAADITVSSSLVNYASPGYLGAPAKAFLANRTTQAPYTRTAVTMAFEQGLDFLVLLAGSLLALALVGPGVLEDAREAGSFAPWEIGLVLGLFVVLAIVAVMARATIRRITGRIIEAFRMLGRRVNRPAVGGLTALYWLLQALVVALLLWALHLPLTAQTWLALSTLPLLAGQIVPLPGGVGAREATIVALAGVTGTSASGLLGLAVLQRVLLVLALPLSLAVLRAGRAAGFWR